jgi:hypothetical protein
MTHDQLQAKCFQHHWNHYPNERGMLFAVRNNAVNKIRGNQDKAIGVVAGVSDLIYISRDGCVIGIEFKVGADSQKAAQRDFQTRLEERGGRYEIVSSFEQFQALVEEVAR